MTRYQPTTHGIQKKQKSDKIFFWGAGPSAIEIITKGEFNTDPDTIKTDKLIQLFREYYMPKRNTYHSRGDFFWAKQEENETPEEHWKKLITLEKNCESCSIMISDRNEGKHFFMNFVESFLDGNTFFKSSRTLNSRNQNFRIGKKCFKNVNFHCKQYFAAFTNVNENRGNEIRLKFSCFGGY